MYAIFIPKWLQALHTVVCFQDSRTVSGSAVCLAMGLKQSILGTIVYTIFIPKGLQRLHAHCCAFSRFTDGFWFCCLASDVPQCFPERDEFSSCEDLMSNYVLRVSIWVLGMVASFGNLLVIGWRARDLRGGKVRIF